MGVDCVMILSTYGDAQDCALDVLRDVIVGSNYIKMDAMYYAIYVFYY